MIFHHQKSIFKESNFCPLCKYFAAMPVVNKHFDSGAKRDAFSGGPKSHREPS
jgi:hypothetical protein